MHSIKQKSKLIFALFTLFPTLLFCSEDTFSQSNRLSDSFITTQEIIKTSLEKESACLSGALLYLAPQNGFSDKQGSYKSGFRVGVSTDIVDTDWDINATYFHWEVHPSYYVSSYKGKFKNEFSDVGIELFTSTPYALSNTTSFRPMFGLDWVRLHRTTTNKFYKYNSEMTRHGYGPLIGTLMTQKINKAVYLLASLSTSFLKQTIEYEDGFTDTSFGPAAKAQIGTEVNIPIGADKFFIFAGGYEASCLWWKFNNSSARKTPFVLSGLSVEASFKF